MVRIRNLVPVLLIGSSLTACATGPEMQNPAWYSNRSYYSENQPVVQRTNYTLDVATGYNGIPASELERLSGWFESIELRYGDRIHLEDPTGSAKVRADLAKLTEAHGVLLQEGAPVTPGAVRPGNARVVVGRSTASVPNCPNWRQAGMGSGLESTESNWGCSINSNVAAMIADPEDLVRGREGQAGGDPDVASKAVKAYRDKAAANPNALKVESVGGK